MVKGDDGLLYIVNDGKICIWDGFKAVPVKIPKPPGIEDKGIEDIVFKDEFIFMKYVDAFAVFNKKTKKYIIYSQHAADPRYRTLSHGWANIFKDHTGQIYITAGAMYKVNADLSLTEYTQLTKQLKEKKLEIEQKIFEDSKHVFWLSCKEGNIVKLTANKTIARHYNILELEKVSSLMFEDSNGRLWLRCWGRGLQLFDTLKGTIKSVTPTLDRKVVHNVCEWRDIHNNNWLVLATEDGVQLLNPITFELKCFKRDHSNRISRVKSAAEPREFFVDDENILWIINYGYNEMVAPIRQQFSNYSLATNYHFDRAPFPPKPNGDDFVLPNRISIVDSNIWIGALYGKGAAVFTKDVKFITNYPNYTQTKSDREKIFTDFNYIAPIEKNKYLVSAYNGLVVWDKKEAFTLFKDPLLVDERGKDRPANFRAICEYSPYKWLIRGGYYIYLFDYKQKKLSRFFSLKDSSQVAVNPKDLRYFQFTKSGFWILFETALIQYDTAQHKITKLFSYEKKGKYYFPENQAIKFVEDDKGHLWIIGIQGLYQFDPKTEKIISYKGKNNLPGAFNNIIIDKKQRLWLLYGSALTCYDIATGRTRSLMGSGSLSGAENYGMWYDSTTHQIWLGADKYLTVFNTENIFTENKNCKVYISEIIQGDSSINFNPTASYYFKLPFDRSSISFHASLSYFNKINEPVLAYRLNSSEGWKYTRDGNFTFNNLAPGNYKLQIAEAFYEGEVIDSSISVIPFKITPPFYKTFWFIALLFAILFAIGYSFFRFRLMAVKAKASAKEKAAQLLQVKTELEKKLSESEMAALQSQMNPHFIFNVLNSINKYILTSDITKASDYLIGFSKLIRMVLENSKATSISLQSDLDALQLYINMEKMRFEGKFESSIEIDNDVDTQFIMIPPLIIQPYVENAIWHGLLQKDGDNKLKVHISQPESNQLLITITDNGIGRKKAMEIKSKSASKNKSFGMQITKDRIGIINKLFNTRASVNIKDLYDGNNNAIGTTVNLRLLI